MTYEQRAEALRLCRLLVPLTLEQQRELVKECGLDWHRGYIPLFDGDPTNRYAVLIEAVELHHGIGAAQPTEPKADRG